MLPESISRTALAISVGELWAGIVEKFKYYSIVLHISLVGTDCVWKAWCFDLVRLAMGANEESTGTEEDLDWVLIAIE